MSLSGNQIAGQDPRKLDRRGGGNTLTLTLTLIVAHIHTQTDALCKEVETAAIVGCLRFPAWRTKRRWRQRRHLNAMESYANSHVH